MYKFFRMAGCLINQSMMEIVTSFLLFAKVEQNLMNSHSFNITLASSKISTFVLISILHLQQSKNVENKNEGVDGDVRVRMKVRNVSASIYFHFQNLYLRLMYRLFSDISRVNKSSILQLKFILFLNTNQ